LGFGESAVDPLWAIVPLLRGKWLLPTIRFLFPLGKRLLETIRFPFPRGKGLGVRFLDQHKEDEAT
jgi:hypothetical protein